MKKLMMAALAVAACTAVAGMDDAKLKADVEGYYDITLTTKSLKHVEQTASKTFTKSNKGSAEDQFAAYLDSVTNNPGFKEISYQTTINKDDEITKITYKCSWFKQDNNGGFKTKVVSENSTGLFDAETGKVYLWDKANKVAVKKASVLKDAKVNNNGEAKGYVAYEVPLALAGNFIKTDDNKAAAGFVGGVAKAADGTELDFTAVNAFGTGTCDAKYGWVKTVSGNVASIDPKDLKYGCYGTWKVNRDSKKYDDLNAALVKKGCVELVEEISE